MVSSLCDDTYRQPKASVRLCRSSRHAASSMENGSNHDIYIMCLKKEIFSLLANHVEAARRNRVPR